jgi:DNA-directed RNA polymerase specialized sigma24 family protein
MSLPQMQWESTAPASRLPGLDRPPPHRGKNFRHELLVEMSVRGTRSPGSKWLKVIGQELERTLKYLLGPDAPLPQLLESARFQALSAWPPPSEQPFNIWLRSIASGVALSHLKGAAPAITKEREDARPGGIREVLSHLYARLRAARPQEQLAFALLDLSGSSVSEAAAVLRAPPATIIQRAARVRRQLLFAARRDALLLRYLCLALRWQAISGSSTALCAEVPPLARRSWRAAGDRVCSPALVSPAPQPALQ